jgi:hypothetical protein
MDIMGNATRHDLPGPLEKGFGFLCFLAVSVGIMFQGATSGMNFWSDFLWDNNSSPPSGQAVQEARPRAEPKGLKKTLVKGVKVYYKKRGKIESDGQDHS